MSYNFTIEHVKALKLHCFDAGLSMPTLFRFASAEQLQACYNGIGPEAWAPGLRSIVTVLLDRFEPEALIHDWEYTHQPKTYGAFTWANIRFAWNAFLCAFRTADTRKKLLAQTAAGLVLATLCQIWGWTGYRTASLTDQ